MRFLTSELSTIFLISSALCLVDVTLAATDSNTPQTSNDGASQQQSDQGPADRYAEWRPLLHGGSTDHLRPGDARIIEDEVGLSEFIRTTLYRPSGSKPPLVDSDARARHIVEFAKLDFAERVVVAVVSLPVTSCNNNAVGVREVTRFSDTALRLTVGHDVFPESGCTRDEDAGKPMRGRYGVTLISVKRPVTSIDSVRLITRIWEGSHGFREIDGELPTEERVE